MLDDDTARELALFAGLEWPEDDREVFAPLIDATVVWANDQQLDEIAAPIVEKLWAQDLRADLERALDAYERRRGTVAGVRADIALGPAGSRLALAYVKQGALDLSGGPHVRGRCLCCLEEGLTVAPADRHERIALDAAVAIVCDSQPEFGIGAPTDEAWAAARTRLHEIAALAEQSLPRLSAALHALADESSGDPIWEGAHAERLYGGVTLPNE